jgi:hypothetical protein
MLSPPYFNYQICLNQHEIAPGQLVHLDHCHFLVLYYGRLGPDGLVLAQFKDMPRCVAQGLVLAQFNDLPRS